MEQNEKSGQLKQPWANLKGGAYVSSDKFMRNSFPIRKGEKVPFVYRQKIDTENIEAIGYQNTKLRDGAAAEKTVHFFIYDDKFESIYENPFLSLPKLRQYKQIMSPDNSLYYTMPYPLQLMGVFKKRWVSAFWQSKGITVIPSVSWGLEDSWEFCFQGIEQGSIIAISTNGSKHNFPEKDYVNGYKKMLQMIKPEKIICYCKPFDSMIGTVEIIVVPHDKVKQSKKLDNHQLVLFDG